METKHTKKEWEILAEDGNLYIVAENKRQLICSIPPKYSHSEANAKLISAAPELLEALIKLRKWAINKGIDIDGKLIVETDSSINKATK